MKTTLVSLRSTLPLVKNMSTKLSEEFAQSRNVVEVSFKICIFSLNISKWWCIWSILLWFVSMPFNQTGESPRNTPRAELQQSVKWILKHTANKSWNTCWSLQLPNHHHQYGAKDVCNNIIGDIRKCPRFPKGVFHLHWKVLNCRKLVEFPMPYRLVQRINAWGRHLKN